MNQKPLERIGDQDITSHIDFTQLAEAGKPAGFDPLFFNSQGILLSHLGKDRIEKGLNSNDPTQKQMFTRVIQQLIHPDAMGESFWTLIQAKGVPLPSLFGAIPNRLSRLVSRL